MGSPRVLQTPPDIRMSEQLPWSHQKLSSRASAGERRGTALPSFPPPLPWLPGTTALSVAHTVFLFNNYRFSEVTNSLQLRKRIKTGKACDGVCMEYCPALEKQQLRSRISGLGALNGYGLFQEFTWFSVPRRYLNTFQSLYD